MTSRAECERLDAADPLAGLRDRFALDPGVIYLDGNSLGAMPRGVAERLQAVAQEEWARGLIQSWNRSGWVDAPARAGAAIARLVGAAPEEVVVADNTSVNLYKALAAALSIQRGELVTDAGNFPTDLYIADACSRQFGSGPARRVPRDRLLEALAPGSVLTVTQVDYRSGHLLDLERTTAAAHAAGALVVWDLCHSVGALPIALSAAGADFAVGCTYKFLNGGPGAPAFIYAAERHAAAASPVPGWFGHRATFEFGAEYAPAVGAARFQTGTPVILGLAALEVALDVWRDVDLEAVRRKSIELGRLAIELVDATCAGLGVEVGSPRVAGERGSQVSLLHADAYPVVQALAARGVIADHRPPNIVRLGLAPLYTRFVDVWDAVAALREVLATGAHRDPRFAVRQRVP